MDEAEHDKPAKMPGKAGRLAPLSNAERKAERLRAALRANLARRKAQARGRADAVPGSGGEDDGSSD